MPEVQTSGYDLELLAPLNLRREAARVPYRDARRDKVSLFLALAVTAGYLIFGRTFAYMGAFGIYPGEILLIATVSGRNGWLRTWLSSIALRPALGASIFLFLIWGCIEGLRGFLAGYGVQDIGKGLVTHYYPLLLFVGLSAGRSLSTGRLRIYYAWLAVATALIPLFMASTAANGVLPWAPDVALLSGPALAPFALVVYFGLSDRLNKGFLSIFFLGIIALLVGGRANVLGAVAGMTPIAFSSRRRRSVAHLLAIGTFSAVLWILFASLLPDFGGRAGRPTPAFFAARLISVVNPEAAAALVEGTDADMSILLQADAGDADWRRNLWQQTISSLDTAPAWLFGHGHGPVLGDLLPGQSGEGYGHDLRTPHNFAIYLLGYTGLVGCLIYLTLLISLSTEIIRCVPSPAKDATIAATCCVVVMALAGNLLETPIGAIPAYVSIGLLLAVAQRRDISNRLIATERLFHAQRRWPQ